MIKVLIVDDEPKLREGMRTLIPWEEEGYTVVATAANGYEALDKFRELKPGLVMADIRMPGMTGLELIAELRKENPGCHVLILSGYADFEYAKQAISYHIDGYLLKPVDEEELISYLQELREKISLEERINEWQALEPARTTEVLVRELLQSKEGGEAAAELGLKDSSCEVVLLELKGLNKGEDVREDAVKRLMEWHWQEEERGFFFTLPPYMGILLKEPLRDERARAALWQELHHLISKEGLEFVAAAGGAAVRPEEAGQSFAAARARLEDAFFSGRRTHCSAKCRTSGRSLHKLRLNRRRSRTPSATSRCSCCWQWRLEAARWPGTLRCRLSANSWIPSGMRPISRISCCGLSAAPLPGWRRRVLSCAR
ncbi:response regulator [Paenibacillus rhizoplanae]